MERPSSRLFSAAILSSLLIFIVGCLVFLSGAATAAVPSASNKTAPVAASTSCPLAWVQADAPHPDPVAYNTELYTTDAVSANDIWAVGDQRDNSNGTQRGYVVHWNGTAWAAIPVPTVGQYPYILLSGVAAISSNNVWISGYSCAAPTCSTFILRWNGTTLNIVASPNVASADNRLTDIVAISANNIWAVGQSSADGYEYKPLTLHWDGTAWSIVATPDIGSQYAGLTTVTATGADDVWALGVYNEPSDDYPLAPISMHWNGRSWSLVSMPVPNQGAPIAINGSAALSSNNAWAVGDYYENARTVTLTYHWNGTAWSILPSPIPEDADISILNDISARSANDIWAVGYWVSGSPAPLYLHWNGTAWSLVFSSDSEVGSGMGGVIMISPTESWAVGYGQRYNDAYDSPLIEHYTAQCATLTPTTIPTNTPTYTPTFTSTPVPPRCPGEHFTDVCPGDYFYQPVLSLNDAGIVAGYNTSPPCIDIPNTPCFKPGNSSSRGQISKIVSLAAGYSEDVTGQTFEDVVPSSTFYEYIERMASHGIISGYPCGGPGEPCVAPGNRPYFRVASLVTRGQLSKMVVGAFNFTEPVSGQAFEDVPVGSTFYDYIGRMAARNIINGYPCGGAGEPCVAPDNRPYFRPTNPVTRGQTAKIVYLSMAQVTPTPTATPSTTNTPTITSTPISTETLTATETSTAEETATTTPTATATP